METNHPHSVAVSSESRKKFERTWKQCVAGFAGLFVLIVQGGAFAEEIPVWQGPSKIEGNISGTPVVHKFGLTRWGKNLNPQNVLPDYPRPQMVRTEWLNLNGHWDFAFAPRNAAAPESFPSKILVPFPVESELSGVQRRLGANDRIWYRRTFDVPRDWSGRRVWLRFGAVDWEAEVFVNGKNVGKHQGGFDPFSFDITDYLKPSGAQEVTVAVWDPTEAGQPNGKQKLKPGAIEYTPCSGIWQTVWLEPVSVGGVERLKMVPDIDRKILRLSAFSSGSGTVEAVVREGNKVVANVSGAANKPLEIPIPHPKLWWPESPFLYDLEVTLKQGGKVVDRVTSYFGMRKVSLGPDADGITRMLLNNVFVLHNGVLDQGYWPDGIYTAPSDEALRYDIEVTKQMGFNMSRKHLKVEPARWYYWADKLGILVWQDMVSADGLQWNNRPPNVPDMVEQYELELKRMIETLYNHPSVVAWVLFNEGLGIKKQGPPMSPESRKIVTRMVDVTRRDDPTRLINHESGAAGWDWQGSNVWDIGLGDIIDWHCYGKFVAPEPTKTRASVVGEYGYAPFQKQAPKYAPLVVKPGCSGFVYTQITDVENEKNGLMDYYRNPKTVFPADEILKLNQELFSKWMDVK